MSDTQSTLLDLVEQMQKKAPEYVDLLRAETDESFEIAFGSMLERAVQGIETNSKKFADLDEEGLTAVLSLALAMPGLTVTQETNSNGHVDLTVVADHCFPARKKLGEAKIYDGPEKHMKGLAQLLERYTTGREGRGLMISYVKKPGITQIVTKLRERMDQDKPSHQQCPTVDDPIKWAFLSKHAHSCGEILDVCHVSCNLFVTSIAKPPTDIS